MIRNVGTHHWYIGTRNGNGAFCGRLDASLFVALSEKLAEVSGDAERTRTIMEMLGATGMKGGRMTEFLKSAGAGGIVCLYCGTL